MKRLTTLWTMLLLMSVALWADQTVTVSANSSDISEGLDLKVVAKLFAEAENLEQFEMMLNNPDSAFCNLDLNGDGAVDYLRVVETGEGNKRLVVLQAILAKDIYQDVASIYVEKDEKDQVSVQVVGDEYVYGTNYIIEPVYVYRPVIYDWFWGPGWYAWRSPWYWDFYPSWWYVHTCWAHDWYWHHCYAYHHHHHCCSFRPGRATHQGYYELHGGVTRRDYAVANPEHSFTQRNSGMTNAREIRTAEATRSRNTLNDRVLVGGARSAGSVYGGARRSDAIGSRTFDSQNTAATRRSDAIATQRNSGAATTQRSSDAVATHRTSDAVSTQRTSGAATTQRSSDAVATQRSSGALTTSQRTSGASTTTQRTSGATKTTQRSSGALSTTQRSSGALTTTQRSSGSYSSSSSSSNRSSGAYSSGSSSSRSSGVYSGGSGAGRSGGGSYSGGGRSSGSVGGSSGGGRSSGAIRR